MAKDLKLSDKDLKEAVNEISSGLYEANLGGSVFKKRVAIHSRGKSAGVRTIVAFRNDKHVFLYMGMQKTFAQPFPSKKKSLLKN